MGRGHSKRRTGHGEPLQEGLGFGPSKAADMSTAIALNDIERASLTRQPLGRLATVDASGASQNRGPGAGAEQNGIPTHAEGPEGAESLQDVDGSRNHQTQYGKTRSCLYGHRELRPTNKRHDIGRAECESVRES